MTAVTWHPGAFSFGGRDPNRLDREIDLVARAFARHEAAVEEMDQHWADVDGSCCPGCMFGDDYSSACSKCERTGEWLVILLRKRGQPDDLRRASALEFRIRYG